MVLNAANKLRIASLPNIKHRRPWDFYGMANNNGTSHICIWEYPNRFRDKTNKPRLSCLYGALRAVERDPSESWRTN